MNEPLITKEVLDKILDQNWKILEECQHLTRALGHVVGFCKAQGIEIPPMPEDPHPLLASEVAQQATQ